MLARDPSPTAEFSAEACDFLATHAAPFGKFSEPFLYLVNVYPTFLTDTKEEMDLFAFIRHADPIKVWIGESQAGSIVRVDHGGQNDNIENLNEGSGYADQENHFEDSDRAGQDETVTIVVDEEFRAAAAADKPKSKKKKRRVVGACGSDHPPKKLREDHGTSGDAGASTGRKSFAAHLGLLERSTLAVKVGVTAAATVPFVTYFVTPMPEREGGGNTDSVFGPNLHTQRPSERFVISSDSSYHYSTNVADAEDDPHDDAHPEGENSAKRQKTSEYEAHVTGESSGQVNEKEQGQSSSRNQEQTDDYDFWTESYASDDDEILTKQVSQDIMEEVSLTINEAELKKIADEMLRQRCTSGDEHQYHIDQMKNFLKSDIVWESRKEILASSHPRKTIPLVQSCQRDPEAPALSLINQDLLYLKKGSLGPEKIVLSLHKFPAIIFNDVDIEERTSRWVNKCVKKFNPYARYGVEHWKNPHAKIFYIKRQKEPGKPKEVVYLNSKIIQVPDYAETGLLWSLSIFIRSSVIWERVHDFQLGIESYQQKVNLTAPTISFPGIEKHKMFSIIYEPVHGIIYKNIKKEKRVMKHSEIHKFCDATLNRVLEGLKSYNNDFKYGYIQRDLNEDEVEYLKLFTEEIEVRLKYRNQMRRWEMYVNRRPLGAQRERPY
ncbi:hypothetical protein Tco_1108382 [Tanacetum coccineum]